MSYFLNKTLGKISAGLSSGNSSKDSAAHAAAAVASKNGNGGTNKAGSGNASGNNSSGFSSFFQRQSTVTYSNQFQQDAQLTLTHLRKIFYEYLHPNMISCILLDVATFGIHKCILRSRKHTSKIKSG